MNCEESYDIEVLLNSTGGDMIEFDLAEGIQNITDVQVREVEVPRSYHVFRDVIVYWSEYSSAVLQANYSSAIEDSNYSAVELANLLATRFMAVSNEGTYIGSLRDAGSIQLDRTDGTSAFTFGNFAVSSLCFDPFVFPDTPSPGVRTLVFHPVNNGPNYLILHSNVADLLAQRTIISQLGETDILCRVPVVSKTFGEVVYYAPELANLVDRFYQFTKITKIKCWFTFPGDPMPVLFNNVPWTLRLIFRVSNQRC